MNPEQFVERLRAIVGERYVLERTAELLPYASDGLPGYHRRPRLVVLPGTRDEVIAVVRLLAEAKVAFVPRGAGTGLSGGALADDVVLVGLHRLKRILAVDPDGQTATVEPGVVNAVLNAHVAPYGLFYAPDPSSETACTIGGNVAENAGGPHCLKYGVTLNHVLAATVVLPDGEVVRLGDASGAMQGYDLLGAFVGSEGCFGIATEITVRLTRRPNAVRTLLADFMTVDAAARATAAIIASGVVPAALEFMDGETVRVVEASIYSAGYPVDAAAVLLIEVDGDTAAIDADVQVVYEACMEAGARTVRVAADARERTALWQGRKKAFGAMGRLARHLVVQDAVIPRSALPDVLAQIRAIGDTHGVRICNVFHAGDGNLHPNIAYNADDPNEAARVHAAMQAVMHVCIEAGGSITGEHGVGLDKLGYMDELFDASTLTAMCDVRTVFDPERRANPGKVVPVHACREWHGRAAWAHDAVVHAVELPSHRGRQIRSIPATTADTRIVEIVQNAAATSRPLRIAGKGQWLDAGMRAYALATHHPTPLSLADDAGIVTYFPDDLTVTVRAGTTLAEIDDVLRARGQWLPLDPLGGSDGSIGATVATASYGPLAALFGTPRDQVLGLTVVTGTGDILRLGGRVVKNVAGFDLVRLMTGAWGTLGVITEVTLRVRARGMQPEANEHMRRRIPAAHGYQEPVIMHPTLSMALKQRFDPHGVLNPGIMPSTSTGGVETHAAQQDGSSKRLIPRAPGDIA